MDLDAHLSGALLALRRYVGAPLPGTVLSLCGLFALDEHRIRIRLIDDRARTIGIDLPIAPAQEYGAGWYVAALRRAAHWMTGESLPGSDREETFDGAALLGELGMSSTKDGNTVGDVLDYLIGDLAGDPLWHSGAASAAQGLYKLLGFDLRPSDVMRLYMRHHNGRLIGVDVSLRSRRGTLREVGLWWPSAKLISILNPEDDTTLAAHRVDGAEDTCCEAVYDLTRWL